MEHRHGFKWKQIIIYLFIDGVPLHFEIIPSKSAASDALAFKVRAVDHESALCGITSENGTEFYYHLLGTINFASSRT